VQGAAWRWPSDGPRCAGEDYLLALAAEKFQGDAERAAQRLLKDFRTGALGRIALELPSGQNRG